jgi:hypothetical protein
VSGSGGCQQCLEVAASSRVTQQQTNVERNVAAVLCSCVCVKCLLLLWVGEWCVPVTRKDATKWHAKWVHALEIKIVIFVSSPYIPGLRTLTCLRNSFRSCGGSGGGGGDGDGEFLECLSEPSIVTSAPPTLAPSSDIMRSGACSFPGQMGMWDFWRAPLVNR